MNADCIVLKLLIAFVLKLSLFQYIVFEHIALCETVSLSKTILFQQDLRAKIYTKIVMRFPE